MTANVTIAPMTPATALEIPELCDELSLLIDEVEGASPESFRAALEQTPVLLPHAWHHSVCDLMLNLFMLETKSDHGSGLTFWPNRGYSMGVLDGLVVPL